LNSTARLFIIGISRCQTIALPCKIHASQYPQPSFEKQHQPAPGLGRAVAIAFAREGASMAINYLPSEEEDAKQVIELIEKAGQRAVAIPGDITGEIYGVTGGVGIA
jgi:uncharacterized iron-regulated membrane protein